jgi:hypothetical protein
MPTATTAVPAKAFFINSRRFIAVMDHSLTEPTLRRRPILHRRIRDEASGGSAAGNGQFPCALLETLDALNAFPPASQILENAS